MLSIIIINYNSYHHIENLLKSAKSNKFLDKYEWIIIDNSPDIQQTKKILDIFPNIIWKNMENNVGFARGNNVGINLASNKNILLLNPDIIFINNDIEKCLNLFLKSNHLVCGVQLLNIDHSKQMSGGNFKYEIIDHFIPGIKHKIQYIKYRYKQKEEIVDWVKGAFLMFKKELVIKDIGFLDEEFFMYHEEMYWCYLIKNKGSICLYNELNIIHIDGASNNRYEKSNKNFNLIQDQVHLSFILRVRNQYGNFILTLVILKLHIKVLIKCFMFLFLKIFKPHLKFENINGLKLMIYVDKIIYQLYNKKYHFYKIID
jgi:GT2 family glycosyltransferase